MYKKTVFINGEASYPTRQISSRYCTILLGRAVINGYQTKKVSDTVFEVEATICGDKLFPAINRLDNSVSRTNDYRRYYMENYMLKNNGTWLFLGYYGGIPFTPVRCDCFLKRIKDKEYIYLKYPSGNQYRFRTTNEVRSTIMDCVIKED